MLTEHRWSEVHVQTDRFDLIKVITRAANSSSRRILGNNVWTGTLLVRIRETRIHIYVESRRKKAIEISRTILRYRLGLSGAIVKKLTRCCRIFRLKALQ